VLTIARNGDTVDETEEISLEATARAAWEYVDTGLATLAVETDRTVEADEDRLVRMFENLFRNAVEHAGEDVTVRVQTHPEGFVVSDDGPGIAPAEREMVFEAGYSGDDGTGLGLAIVHKIALAHGWDVTVAESDAGGARFEFVDIESVAEEPKAKEQT
jgi:signal transduction histidine kinase